MTTGHHLEARPLPQLLGGRFGRETVGQGAQHIGLLDGKAEHARRVADRRPAAEGDVLADHRGMLAAVPLVDVLQDLLAVAMGEVDVDVGRLFPLLAQEALEQQVHLHRIDRRDAEAVADHGVGRRPAPLAEHPRPPREAHDIPDDQEVAGEAEFPDEGELVVDLLAIFRGQVGNGEWGMGNRGCSLWPLASGLWPPRWSQPLHRSLHNELRQVRVGRYARWQVKVRQRRPEVLEPECTSLGDA